MTLRPLAALVALCCLALPSSAQERPPERQAELSSLEALLEDVDAALTTLEPLTDPALTLRHYDLRHLFYAVPDRPGPNLSVPGAAAGYRTASGGGGSFSFEDAGEEDYGIDPDMLEQILTLAVGEDDDWREPRSIQIQNGFLIVRQTALGHARIAQALASLRAERIRAVQLEVGFYALPPELHDQLDAASAGTQGVLAPDVLAMLDRWAAEGRATLQTSGLLTALDQQRIYLHHGIERSYIAGYERSSGGTQAIVETVSDPDVQVLRTGLALDVRPTVLQRGGQTVVSLDVRFLRTRPLALEERTTPWGPLLTPQITLDSVRTSAEIPPGAGMLVFSTRGGAGDGETSEDPARDVAIVVRPRLLQR